jgi:hypothetical protein
MEDNKMFEPDEYAAGAAMYERYLEQAEQAAELKELYQDYPDQILITKVIECGKRINQVVPNNGFRAFDIAIAMYNNNKRPTPKQRKALMNVLVQYKVYGLNSCRK